MAMKCKTNFDKLSSLRERVNAETPLFFRKLRLLGLVTVTIGTTILAAPVAIPAFVTTLSGYIVLGGTVLTAVSQITVENE
jgi:ABC-type xylose transport system permease subunit